MTSELAVWDDVPRAEEGRKTSSRPVDLVHLSRYTLGERESSSGKFWSSSAANL